MNLLDISVEHKDVQGLGFRLKEAEGKGLRSPFSMLIAGLIGQAGVAFSPGQPCQTPGTVKKTQSAQLTGPHEEGAKGYFGVTDNFTFVSPSPNIFRGRVAALGAAEGNKVNAWERHCTSWPNCVPQVKASEQTSPLLGTHKDRTVEDIDGLTPSRVLYQSPQASSSNHPRLGLESPAQGFPMVQDLPTGSAPSEGGTSGDPIHLSLPHQCGRREADESRSPGGELYTNGVDAISESHPAHEHNSVIGDDLFGVITQGELPHSGVFLGGKGIDESTAGLPEPGLQWLTCAPQTEASLKEILPKTDSKIKPDGANAGWLATMEGAERPLNAGARARNEDLSSLFVAPLGQKEPSVESHLGQLSQESANGGPPQNEPHDVWLQGQPFISETQAVEVSPGRPRAMKKAPSDSPLQEGIQRPFGIGPTKENREHSDQGAKSMEELFQPPSPGLEAGKTASRGQIYKGATENAGPAGETPSQEPFMYFHQEASPWEIRHKESSLASKIERVFQETVADNETSKGLLRTHVVQLVVKDVAEDPLRIRLRVNNDTVDALFLAQSLEQKASLESQLGQLRQELTNHGFLPHLAVELGGKGWAFGSNRELLRQTFFLPRAPGEPTEQDRPQGQRALDSYLINVRA